MTDMNEALALSDVTFSYGGTEVLHSLSQSFGPGIHGILGPNGAGKTTLLRIISTEIHAKDGTLSVLGIPIDGIQTARRARRSIGYLPQHFAAYPGMTVQQFVAYVAYLRGSHRSEISGDVSLAIRKVDLTSKINATIKSLSGGMRQRVGLAAALVGSPPILILDEPTVGLDPQQRIEVKEILRAENATVILSTHIVDDISAVADRVVVMDGGRFVYNGTPEDMNLLGRDESRGDSPMERAYMKVLEAARS